MEDIKISLDSKEIIKNYLIENSYWKLQLTKKDNNYIYKLFGKLNFKPYSDLDYYYGCSVNENNKLEPLILESREVVIINNYKLKIIGKFINSPLIFEHVFETDKESIWLDEYIKLKNNGSENIELNNINFGFLKKLFFQPQGWFDNLDEYKLTSIPTRRFHGQLIDRRCNAFSANDIVNAPWFEDPDSTLKPGFCSEGWIWSNKSSGILICKYNLNEIEYSRFERFSLPSIGRGVENLSIIFGGAYLYKNQPEKSAIINAGASYVFGLTRYASFSGDYKEGYYLYRNHLEEKGHKYSNSYNPPLNWNELYNLGCIVENYGAFSNGTNKKILPYNLDQLFKEAEIAKEIGAELFYLDPGWDIYYGSSIWDTDRLGKLKDFSKIIHQKYGLKLGMQLCMCFLSDAEDKRFFFINKNGEKVKYCNGKFIPIFHFCANEFWVKEKTKRILKLLEADIDFLVFDGTSIPDLEEGKGCFSPEHNHEIPMQLQTHADNILKVIQNVKKVYPKVLIETHDRITGGLTKEGHPLYFQHNLMNSYDENWGFEYMWNAMQDLISLKAMSLFEYSLAYSIPLYLHINENSDNNNMLQFWWYASVVRHLGIGGLKDKLSSKFLALKKAVKLYHRLKKYYTSGKFIGLDEMIHLHLDENNNKGVINIFNLSSKIKDVEFYIDLTKYGINFKSINVVNGLDEKISGDKIEYVKENLLKFHLNIPPLSPLIVEFS